MANKEYPTYNLLQPLLLAAMISVGMMVGYKMNNKPETSLVASYTHRQDSLYTAGRIEELLRFIESKYVDELDDGTLTESAIMGIISQLDPHSLYLTPEEVIEVEDEMSGSYYGIGIENNFYNDTVVVRHVFKGGPADLAGIKVFDKIIAIDGDTVAGKNVEYGVIRQMMRRKAGEQIDLYMNRFGEEIALKIKVDKVDIRMVSSIYIDEVEAAYIKIRKFGNKTYREFMEEVEDMFENHQAKHLILDLRGNPGGYLPEAIKILSQIFEEKEQLMLYTQGRNKAKHEYKTTGSRFFKIDKVIVIVDEGSASASEIIAGAIQDWDRGFIIGRPTYGKGLVQEQYQLNNGGAIRLTVSRYYTPTGRSIQKDYGIKTENDKETVHTISMGEEDITKEDSFNTLLLKRKVIGGHGITPDIFIGDADYDKSGIESDVEDIIKEFVFDYLSNRRELLNFDFNKQNMDAKMEMAAAHYLGLSVDGSDASPHLPKNLVKLIQDEASKINLTLKSEESIINLDDKYIFEAIRIIKDKIELTDLNQEYEARQ